MSRGTQPMAPAWLIERTGLTGRQIDYVLARANGRSVGPRHRRHIDDETLARIDRYARLVKALAPFRIVDGLWDLAGTLDEDSLTIIGALLSSAAERPQLRMVEPTNVVPLPKAPAPAPRLRSSFTCSCGRVFGDKHALRKHLELTKHGSAS